MEKGFPPGFWGIYVRQRFVKDETWNNGIILVRHLFYSEELIYITENITVSCLVSVPVDLVALRRTNVFLTLDNTFKLIPWNSEPTLLLEKVQVKY